MTDFRKDYMVSVENSVFQAIFRDGSSALVHWAGPNKRVREVLGGMIRRPIATYVTYEVTSSFKYAFDLLIFDLTNKPASQSVVCSENAILWQKILARLETLARMPKATRDLTLEALHVAIELNTRKPSAHL